MHGRQPYLLSGLFPISKNNFLLTQHREEPILNSAIPGDVRDTSTPKAMAASLQRLALGDVLTLPQRELFQAWLKKCPPIITTIYLTQNKKDVARRDAIIASATLAANDWCIKSSY